MLIRAEISKGYLAKLGMVVVFCIGASAWAVYDGAVAYPRQRERALMFEELREENRLDEWEEVARERGWPVKDPGKPKTQYDFENQFIMAAALAPVGVLFLFFLVRNRKRWIEATETSLSSSRGDQLDYSQIVTLDKKVWKNKGIARITYDEEGREKRLVLDDCKYDPDATEAILRHVESEIDGEKIVGGPPQGAQEAAPEEEAAHDPDAQTPPAGEPQP